jgi:hypothetical protein
MDRFFASKNTSSSNAVQPVRNASTSASTVAQPADQLTSISEVQRWLKTLTGQTASTKLQRIKAAVDVLKAPKPRKEDVHPLCPSWPVQRKIQKKDRPLADIISDLTKEVIRASNKLKVSLAQNPPVATDNAVQPDAPSDVDLPRLGSPVQHRSQHQVPVTSLSRGNENAELTTSLPSLPRKLS